MPLTWNEFRKGLMREITDTKSTRAFERACDASSELARFADPESLTAWLLRHGRDRREEEDALLRALIGRYRKDERRRGIWLALLILALWPSLTWVFQKLWPIAKGLHGGGFAPEDGGETEVVEDKPRNSPRSETHATSCLDEIIAGAIWGALTDVLEDGRVCEGAGIAKRLMYAVWKGAKAQLLDAQTEQVRQERLGEALEHSISRHEGKFLFGPDDVVPSPFQETQGDRDGRPPDAELADLAGRLVTDFSLSVSDADLVVRHAVLDETLAAIARERETSFPALRQRYSRAIRKIRSALQENRPSGCHTFGPFRLGVMEEESSADETLH